MSSQIRVNQMPRNWDSTNRRKYAKRRFFTTVEIKLMQKLAKERKSQSAVAKILNRTHGSIAVAALRYGIKFNAPLMGKPRKATANESTPATEPTTEPESEPEVTRFDDPRVMR